MGAQFADETPRELAARRHSQWHLHAWTTRWVMGVLVFWGCWTSSQATSDVGQRISWFHPSDLQLTIDDVSSPEWAGRFEPLTDSLKRGFSIAPVWLKIELSSTQPQAQNFWLEIGNPLIEQVELYERNNQESTWVKRLASAQTTETWQRDTRRRTFAIWIEPQQTQVVFLKIQSRTSLSTTISLHHPVSLIAADEQESFIWGLVLGAYLLVVIFYAIFWAYTREKVHLFYTLYIASNLGAAFFSGGWNHTLGIPPTVAEQSNAIGIFIALPVFMSAVFSVEYLKAKVSWPVSARVYVLFCLAITLAMMAMTWLGHYSQAATYFQSLTIGLIVMNTLALIALSYQGLESAKLMLYAFTIFHLGIAWRYLRNIGILEANVWNDNAYQIGAFIHMLVMSSGIFSNYRKLENKSHELKALAEAETAMLFRQSQFLNMVSHEIRTPLAVILACTDNIQSQKDLQKSAQDRVLKIQRNAEKIELLFGNYLDSAQLLNGQSPVAMRHVDLSTLCTHVARDFNENSLSSIETEIQHNVYVHADSGLIAIALHNLLDNAAKYSSVGLSIQISLHATKTMAQLRVIDSGQGIEPQDLPHIFESYYRGRNTQDHSGIGMGLNLVQYIVQQHMGQISVQSNPGRGMTFCIELPLAAV